MEPTESKTESPRRNRRWFQYSLRTLLAVMLLASVGMSWFAVKMQRARRQKEAVEAITKLGRTNVSYDYEIQPDGKRTPDAVPPGPAWLRNLLGQDFFSSVVEMSSLSSFITDADLEHVKGLRHLQEVYFNVTKLTDAGLEHLEGLRELQRLTIRNTHISDAGLKHLEGLRQLKMLDLFRTDITDAGLRHLKGMTQLQRLGLGSNEVADAGLEYLAGMTQLRELDLSYTQVTDAGLEHLAGLVQLHTLDIDRTEVTDEGVKKLQRALPNCKIEWEPPTPPAR